VTDKFTTKGLADYFIDQRRYTNQFLDKIDALIEGYRKSSQQEI
jgi:transposase, IS5 family